MACPVLTQTGLKALMVFCAPVPGSIKHLVLGCFCEGAFMLHFGLTMTGGREVLSLTLISTTLRGAGLIG